MILQIPLTSDGAQNVTVLLGSIKYDLYVRWNTRAAKWMMDLANHATQVNLVQGVALVLGQDLLGPYALGVDQFTGNLVVNDEDNTGVDAGPDDLGARVNLYWFSDYEADLATLQAGGIVL